jgi:hypothetical protein
MQELFDNVNIQVLSIEAIVKVLQKPNGYLKKFNIIKQKLFAELIRRD